MGLFQRGSEWRKWDLHVHTPIDHEWIDKPNIRSKDDYKNFAKSFINFAKEENLSVLAIVDHNFCNDLEECYLPYIIDEAKQNNITILPGFEITVMDGSGIHLLVIFKEDTNLNKIQAIVKQCFDPGQELIPQNGQVPISNKTIDQLKNLLDTSNEDYILIFAHADRDNGVLDKNTISGGRRVKEWKKTFINIAQLSKKPEEFQAGSFIDKVVKKEDANYARDITYVVASDCRTLDKNIIREGRFYLGQKFVWIKADPTFEGLKQIIYEPKDRVKIQEEKPEQKEPYNLIDYVCFEDSNEIFTNEKILLNQNLNVIIGGKSTGKSILLREIARTINPYEVERRLKEANLSDYDEYEENKALTDDFIVRWIDGREDKRSNGNSDDYRKIIYIPQSYLNRLTDKEEEQSPIDKLVEEILKNNEEVKSLYEEMIDKINENNRNISFEIENLFEKLEKFYEKINEIKNLGDEEGIRKYIVNLNEEIENLQKDGGLSEKEIKKYNNLKKSIDHIKNYINDLMTKKNDFEKIINSKKFRVEYNLEQIINKYEDLNEIINIVLSKAEKEFNKTLTDKIKFLENEINNKQKELKLLESQINPLEEKVKNSKVIIEKNKKLQNEKDKLNKILEKKQEANKYREIIHESINNLVNYFIDFYRIKNILKLNVEKNHNLSEDLELIIDIKIKNNEFNNEFIEDVFNLRSLPEEYKDFKLDIINLNNLKEQIKKIISDVLNDKIKVKNKYVGRKKEIIQRLINDWFVINYQIIYDGDTISKMSPGKKSFVLLRLIVELDKSKCPLLIDQPEDDLDNRSVYKEVVKYIRGKKKERQIIIATHNPNLVVAADAECVIVANQHGEKNKNRKFKFEYVQGSLENTFIKSNIEEVLYKQGIKEHVCEILEGGEEAFEKRKNKYEI